MTYSIDYLSIRDRSIKLKEQFFQSCKNVSVFHLKNKGQYPMKQKVCI